MGADGYTIGEVLNQLKEDFEDITISKIRFLESEGLIFPDRTDSGYRKFSGDDVDRLRFILTAQRDHYLPLKVIREQLEKLDSGDVDPQANGGAAAPVARPVDPAAISGKRAQEIGKAVEAAISAGDNPVLDSASSQLSMTLREFCEASGLDQAEVRALREFGIVGERGDEVGPFDGDDLLAAKAAKELLQLGLEPRHLRMYRQFVDREIALFEQLVTPLLRQRNPEARRQATKQLEKLSGLTGQLKRSLLARALRGYMHGT